MTNPNTLTAEKIVEMRRYAALFTNNEARELFLQMLTSAEQVAALQQRVGELEAEVVKLDGQLEADPVLYDRACFIAQVEVWASLADERAETISTLRASLAAMTEREEAWRYSTIYDATIHSSVCRERDAATAALLAIGCKCVDGAWMKSCPECSQCGCVGELCNACDYCKICTDGWLPITPAAPISPPPSPAAVGKGEGK